MKAQPTQPVHHRETFKRKLKHRQDRFLHWFGILGLMRLSAKRAGVSYDIVNMWRKKYPDFEAKYLEADAMIGRIAEEEAVRRGIYGIRRGVYYEGKRVALEKEYSDTLLAKILSARDGRYRAKPLDEADAPFSPAVINITVVPDKPPVSPPK